MEAIMYIGVVKTSTSVNGPERINRPPMAKSRREWSRAAQDAQNLVDYYSTSHNSVSWDVLDTRDNSLTR